MAIVSAEEMFTKIYNYYKRLVYPSLEAINYGKTDEELFAAALKLKEALNGRDVEDILFPFPEDRMLRNTFIDGNLSPCVQKTVLDVYNPLSLSYNIFKVLEWAPACLLCYKDKGVFPKGNDELPTYTTKDELILSARSIIEPLFGNNNIFEQAIAKAKTGEWKL